MFSSDDHRFMAQALRLAERGLYSASPNPRVGCGSVVPAMRAPNPQVAGQGMARLEQAGIKVDVGLMEQAARELNIGFVSRMTRGRPWVRLKTGGRRDGKTPPSRGKDKWLS